MPCRHGIACTGGLPVCACSSWCAYLYSLAQNTTLQYARLPCRRPYKVWRHVIGTDPAQVGRWCGQVVWTGPRLAGQALCMLQP